MTALVISASSDLGMEIARVLSQKGCELQLTHRSHEGKEKLDSVFGSKPGVRILEFEALDPGSSWELINELDPLPDLVYICTGYLGDHGLALKDEAEMDRIIRSNFYGLTPLIHGLANQMEKKGGTIVGISSVAGERGRQGNFFYGAAKKGLTTLLDGYRHYFAGTKLRFVTAIPGYIKTRMLQEKTPGFLTTSPQAAARQIVEKSMAGKDRFYVGPIWFWVMMVIRNIPEFIFKKLKI